MNTVNRLFWKYAYVMLKKAITHFIFTACLCQCEFDIFHEKVMLLFTLCAAPIPAVTQILPGIVYTYEHFNISHTLSSLQYKSNAIYIYQETEV